MSCELNRSNVLVRGLILALLALPMADAAMANPFAFASPRQQAMGGAGVALSDDSSAIYWNPANLALRKASDAQLNATLNVDVESKALTKLDELITASDEASAVLDSLDLGNPAGSLENAQAVVDFANALGDYGKNGEAVHFGLNIGLLGRHNSFGFSAMSYTVGTVFPNVDVGNLGFATTPNAINDLADGLGLTPVDTALAAEVDAASSNISTDAANSLVFLFEEAGADTSDPNTRDLILGTAACTETGADCNALSGTGAVVGGLSTQEFGFSYATKLPFPFFAEELLDRKISVGATAKYILGITYVSTTTYDDVSDAGDIVSNLSSLDNTQISHNFGLDLALTYTPFDFLRVGLVARNVNSPSFDINELAITSQLADAAGVPLRKLTLDSQVRMGAAIMPVENLWLTLDADLMENKITSLPGFTSQIVSMGSEYTIEFTRSIDLALRFGAYTNTAGRINQDWALTGGFGLRLWQFVLDASAGGSLESERITTGSGPNDFVDLPTRLNAGLVLKWEKSI